MQDDLGNEKQEKNLRTLKDFTFAKMIEYTDEEHDEECINDLKSEAIKWIQYLQELKYYKNKKDMKEDKECIVEKYGKLWAIQWIKHFFNISEDELK